LILVLLTHVALAQDAVQLISPTDPAAGWTFNNGAEFPGAKGSLAADASEKRGGQGSLKLVGDFTGGGGYVQAGRKIDDVDIRELSLWLKLPGTDRLTLRLSDASGQTHQIVLKAEATDDWQQIVLPLARFFERRGEADAVTTVAKYESWGGAKDGRWHGPAKAIYLLLSKRGENIVRNLWLGEVSILPKATAVKGAEVATSIRLDEIDEGGHDWGFSLGQEFPGAKGSLAVASDDAVAGKKLLRLAGDFTGGGGYVAAIRNLNELEVADISAFRMRVRSQSASSVSVQLVDASGQTHQRKGIKITADGQWHDLVLRPAEFAGSEHWGGANDAKWHTPAQKIVISLAPRSNEQTKQPAVDLAEIRAEALVPVFAQPAAFKESFERESLGESWKMVGSVALGEPGFSGKKSLALSRTLDKVNDPCSVQGPAFPAAPGQWEISVAAKADLHSPDNSYSAVVALQCLAAGGQELEQITVADLFGKRDWQPVKKLALLPAGTASARMVCQLNKTYGTFWLDDVTASYLAPAPRKDDRITRLLFSTPQLGNLLFPSDPRLVTLTVEAKKPLRESQQSVTCVVRDYWGAEQMEPATVMLSSAERKDGQYVYQASLDLARVPLQTGRYYELHATIAGEGTEPFTNHTSFAILPEAITRQYKPDEVPFTSRNWDNRISQYIRLSDRLGVRICGLWGGWSAKAPYAPEAPGLELCQSLGMGWLTTTPAKFIERGSTDYSEESLRQGVRNLIEKHGHVRPFIINLGNEPHGTGERVKANVAAYKVIYEEVKKVDPTIPVVATSVEPNEEYFAAGYGQWCDAYDFHIYEDSANVRRTMEKYRELARKYGHEKPIWSTELGLNSQGQTRHTVAVELVKKFATFFAAGGQNVSWFGLLYPDADGKQHGSSGDSHNVFDCRYNRYAPRLDAVAYYHAVNSIAIKKFAEEKEYPQGIHATLFRDRDGRSLQVLWKDKGRQDVLLPLAGVKDVQIIHIDGSSRALDAGGEGITLSVSEDPLLVLYQGDGSLAKVLGPPLAAIAAPPATISRRGPTTIGVALAGIEASEVGLVLPPFWKADKTLPAAGQKDVRFTLHPPAGSAVREADVIVTLGSGPRRGELYLRAVMAD
jgi:hypothetical protein